MRPLQVLLLESIAEPAHQLLAQHAQIYMPTDLKNEVPINAIITRGKGQVNRALIDAHPNLKVVARCGVGLNNIDVEYAQSKGIEILNTPGLNAASVAEHTIALLLNLQRHIHQSVQATKNDYWDFRNTYQGDEVRGKTLGILGMGNIGRRVAKIAAALELQVVYWDRMEQEVPFRFLSFEEVLQEADILSLHLPLTKETTAILGQDQLMNLPKKPLLLNTARAELINTTALVQALEHQHISGYAADVARSGTAAEKRLLQLEQVLITPHIASLTARTYEEICMTAVRKVLACLV